MLQARSAFVSPLKHLTGVSDFNSIATCKLYACALARQVQTDNAALGSHLGSFWPFYHPKEEPQWAAMPRHDAILGGGP
jgi:hypothetical protein